MLILIIVLLLVFGLGGGYYAIAAGCQRGAGVGLGTILVILLIAYMLACSTKGHAGVELRLKLPGLAAPQRALAQRSSPYGACDALIDRRGTDRVRSPDRIWSTHP